MQKLYVYMSLAFLLVVAPSCAHRVEEPKLEGRPQWIDTGSSPRYPSRFYLTGVGTGSTRKNAEDAARTEIARYMKVKISASSYDWMKSEISTGTTEQFSQRLESAMTTAVDQALEGTSIAEIWEDRGRNSVYALAILDRERVASVLKERILKIDADVAALLEQKTSQGRFSGLSQAVSAAEALQKREVLNAELIMVSPEGSGVQPRYAVGEVMRKIESIIAGVRIGLDLTGDSTGDIRLALVRGLSQARMQVVTNAESADIVIKGQVEVARVDENNPWFWYLSMLRGEIVDPKSGTYMGTLTESSREGAQDQLRGRVRSLESLSDKVASRVKKEIITFSGK